METPQDAVDAKLAECVDRLADALRAHYGDALVSVGVADDMIVVYWKPGTRTELESSFHGYSISERCMTSATPAVSE